MIKSKGGDAGAIWGIGNKEFGLSFNKNLKKEGGKK